MTNLNQCLPLRSAIHVKNQILKLRLLPDITINIEGFTKLLKKLNPNRATRPDGIFTGILQLTIEELAPPFVSFFRNL